MYKLARKFSQSKNIYDSVKKKIGPGLEYYSIADIDKKVESLPFSIKVLLENAVRNNDGFVFCEKTVETLLNWKEACLQDKEIPFKPSRVLLQDFTGVPCVVDLAAMRDYVKKNGGDPSIINPLCPVDLVIDHSIQVDNARSPESLKKNEEIEFNRNRERFQFLKWGQSAFNNFRIIPPGNGIVHQVNLEYLAKVVFNSQGLLYPDSVIGTDSHTTMINGLGVVGWGVGGIEAEAVMLGQHISMVLPQVVGFKLTGKLQSKVTATDIVLTVTQMLRKRGVVGKFVEFYGSGVGQLTLEDRATIANMAPEYGATIGFFPVDEKSIDYLRRTGRDKSTIDTVEAYLKNTGMFRNYKDSDGDDSNYTGKILHLDLGSVEPCLSGPKRPQDKVLLSSVKTDFQNCLANPQGFKGFGLKEGYTKSINFNYKGKDYTLNNGDVVISSITSCTNTSNPGVIIGAGLLAKKALEKGLSVKPFIKTSLSPGSGVVEKYLRNSGLLKSLEGLGFYIAGFGCMTCIGNSGELDESLQAVLRNSDIIVSAVLSGNRNFEGRVHPRTKANYLASPPLCVAYALAGTVDFNFDSQPLGKDQNGKDVFLADIWPSNEEIKEIMQSSITEAMFKENYANVLTSNNRWNEIKLDEGTTYKWDDRSTYIHNPPFFQNTSQIPRPLNDINNAYCLLKLGDFITTDHISPAGKISSVSAAAVYLTEKGVAKEDFNTYGARRGNDEIMARGTFANIRLRNQLIDKEGPRTLNFLNGKEDFIFNVAMEYKSQNIPSIIIAGAEYGSGSSRDWAAKGPDLLGVKAVIAQSFERIHRSNLIGMGVLPIQFLEGQTATGLGIKGTERFTIPIKKGDLGVKEIITITTDTGLKFEAMVRLDTPIEIEYFKNDGILKYVLRNLLKK